VNTYFKNSRILAIVIFLGLMDGGTNAEERSAANPHRDKTELSHKEAATLRTIVYTKGRRTSHEISRTGGLQRVLVIPREFEELYKAKRMSALQLLLDIVKGGRPEDALSAATFAIAMEEDPIMAAFHLSQSTEDFDDDPEGGGDTPRTRLVKVLEKNIHRIGIGGK
jgi:hypothetical protein